MGDWLTIAQGAASGAASSAIGGIANAIMAPGAAHYNRENARAAMDYQNQINIRNAKNKYSYELESMRRAGLNPALMQGGMNTAGVTGGTGSSSFSPDMHVNSPDISANAVNIAQLGQVESETKKNETQSAVNEAQERFIDQQTKNASEQGYMLGVDALYYRQKMQKQLQQIDLNNRYIEEQTGLTREQKYKASQEVDFLYQTWDAQVAQQHGLANEINMRGRLLTQQYNFNVDAMPKQLGLLTAQIYLANSQGHLANSQAQFAMKSCAQLDEVIEGLKMDNRFKRETLDGAIEVAKLQNKAGKLKLLPEVEKLKGYLNRGRGFFEDMGVMQFEAVQKRLEGDIEQAIFALRENRANNTSSDAYLSICAEVGMICDALNFSCGSYSATSSSYSQSQSFVNSWSQQAPRSTDYFNARGQFMGGSYSR